MVEGEPSVLDELLALASDTATEAGALLMRHWDTGTGPIQTKAGAGDVVTNADRESEALIMRRLLAVRPDDSVIAEESGTVLGNSGLTWVIDPLDGSSNFVHSATPFAVSIAVCDSVQDRRLSPLVAVLFDPVHREVFQAIRGRGATLNGVPLRRPTPRPLRGALVGTGFAHTDALRNAQLSVLSALLPRVGDLRRSGAGAVDLCWVAAGRIEAFYQPGLKVWDFAAAQLIAAESGTCFTLASGLAGSTETVIASVPELGDEFLAALYASGIHPLDPSADGTVRSSG